VLKQFSELWWLLDGAERRQFILLLLAMTAAAVLDVLGIASVGPFLALLGGSGAGGSRWLAELQHYLGTSDQRSLFIVAGLASLCLVTLANLLNGWVALGLVYATNLAGFSLGRRLLRCYVTMEHQALLDRSPTEMSKDILSEADRVATGVLTPTLTLVSRAITIVFVLALLFYLNPMLAITLGVLLGGFYVVTYRIIRKRLAVIGKRATASNAGRFKVVTETFGAARELRLYGRLAWFVRRFDAPALAYARDTASSMVMGQLPRFVLEPVAFAALIIVSIFVVQSTGDLGRALPVVGVYAFAGYRLVPSLQLVFASYSNIQFFLPALNLVVTNLRHEKKSDDEETTHSRPVKLDRELALDAVSFRYAREPVLDRIDLRIAAGSTVGLVGQTGAGKTTLLSLILGLLKPTNGCVRIDDQILADNNRASWQRRIGYVPQDVFLLDDTVAANIALGIPPEKIDMPAVERSAKLAGIHDFAVRLPQGYATTVGERGARLSGGQRQRIAIARALYHDPQLIVFDEGTSGLDVETEEAVLSAIDAMAGTRTIIIVSHRASTLRRASVVHLLEGGRVVASGTPDRFTHVLGAERLVTADATGA
jgi:ATP-binding cassette, subfamily B, bacterial PglK